LKGFRNHCGDGWVCETHPDKPFPHDDCPGPGMPCLDPTCSHAEGNAKKEGEAALKRADEVEAGAPAHGLSADEWRERGERMMKLFRTLRARRERLNGIDPWER
jgi:hypothetical protein